MIGRSAGAVLVVLLAASAAAGQDRAVASKPHAACGAVEEGYGRPQRPPAVRGKTYVVPRLRLLVTDERTGAPVAGREVIVRYVWRWFEYPYPERPLGVWSDAYDLVRCVTDARGAVEMSEYGVEPVGWYKGRVLFGRKPEFTHLDVSVHLEKHITHFRVTKGELKSFRERRAEVIPLRVSLTSPLLP